MYYIINLVFLQPKECNYDNKSNISKTERAPEGE